MALLFMDGFDHVDDDYDLLKWDAVGSVNNVIYASGYGRTGGWGVNLNNWAQYLQKNIPNTSHIFFGYAFKYGLEPYVTGYELKFRDNTSSQISVRFNLDGSIGVYRNTTLLGTTASGCFSMNTWSYFEIGIVFDSTVGSVEVRIAGSDTPILLLTGQNTIITANNYITNVQLFGANDSLYIDDVYICDTSGTESNDFLGDVTITTLYPTADGNSSDFTPSTGVDNYATVDEPQLAGVTDYNSSSTIGAKDTFQMTTLTGDATVLAVQTTAAVNNTTTGTIAVRGISRSGTVPADNEGSDFMLSQTVKAAMDIFEKEPTDNVAWTVAKVNAAEFGIKIQS